MTLRAPYYQHEGVTIYNGDCLAVLPELPDNSVDLILTDPPYFKVKGEAWDNQWDKPAEFLAWLDRVLAEFARVLKPNGSLYLFASPQMGARVEILVGGRFQVLNNIRWRKEEGRHKAACKEELRAFFPASETIIFAEHVGADNAAKGESGYERKCDELRGFIFEPVRKYLDDERVRCGVSKKAIETATGTQMCSHWFTQSQWALPTAEHYATLQRLFNESSEGDFLRKEYDFLRKESCDARFLLALKCHTLTCGILRRSETTQASTSAKSPRPCFGTSYRHLASLARWCSMRLVVRDRPRKRRWNLAAARYRLNSTSDGVGSKPIGLSKGACFNGH